MSSKIEAFYTNTILIINEVVMDSKLNFSQSNITHLNKRLKKEGSRKLKCIKYFSTLKFVE